MVYSSLYILLYTCKDGVKKSGVSAKELNEIISPGLRLPFSWEMTVEFNLNIIDRKPLVKSLSVQIGNNNYDESYVTMLSDSVCMGLFVTWLRS